MIMILRGAVVAFLVSQSAWPMMYSMGSNSFLRNPIVMFGVGAVFIPAFAWLLLKLLPRNFQDKRGVWRQRNAFYYMCCLFAWSCTIDLIGYLEASGVVDGYFDFYLQSGEPYLGSAFGIWIDFWDATVHFLLYLIIIFKYDNGQDYTRWGLYWFGCMAAGMFCLVVGAVVGSFGGDIHPATLLNIPYIAMPFVALKYLLDLRRSGKQSAMSEVKIATSVWSRILLIGLLISMFIGLLRGLVALGSPLALVTHYATQYEPYIREPGKFGAMHCLFNFMYGLPVQVVLTYCLVNDVKSKKSEELSLILSGAMAHSEFFHLAAAFSKRTPEEFRITKNHGWVLLITLFPVVISHMLLLKFRLRTGKITSRARKDE